MMLQGDDSRQPGTVGARGPAQTHGGIAPLDTVNGESRDGGVVSNV